MGKRRNLVLIHVTGANCKPKPEKCTIYWCKFTEANYISAPHGGRQNLTVTFSCGKQPFILLVHYPKGN